MAQFLIQVAQNIHLQALSTICVVFLTEIMKQNILRHLYFI